MKRYKSLSITWSTKMSISVHGRPKSHVLALNPISDQASMSHSIYISMEVYYLFYLTDASRHTRPHPSEPHEPSWSPLACFMRQSSFESSEKNRLFIHRYLTLQLTSRLSTNCKTLNDASSCLICPIFKENWTITQAYS